MEVERKKNEMKFSLIPSGECFIDCYNNVCIKFDDVISDEDDELYNAVEVTSGDILHYFDDEMVTPVKAKLIIE